MSHARIIVHNPECIIHASYPNCTANMALHEQIVAYLQDECEKS